MKKPHWVSKAVTLAIHDRLLADYGGSAGLRDEGLLESALGRPENLFAYERPSLFDLASSYAFGIVRNHPFIDGNKRTGFVVCATFLDINGRELVASELDATLKTLALAAGELTEAQYSKWLSESCRKL